MENCKLVCFCFLLALWIYHSIAFRSLLFLLKSWLIVLLFPCTWLLIYLFFQIFLCLCLQLFEYDVCRNETLSVYPTWCYINSLQVNIFHQTRAFSANISLNVFSFTFVSILSFMIPIMYLLVTWSSFHFSSVICSLYSSDWMVSIDVSSSSLI